MFPQPLLSTLETFLRERKWVESPATQLPAVRVASHVLTYPLTLAYAMQQIGLGMRAMDRPLRITVLGARAEASLPASWWRECLRAIRCERADVTFTGPDTPVPESAARAGTLVDVCRVTEGDRPSRYCSTEPSRAC